MIDALKRFESCGDLFILDRLFCFISLHIAYVSNTITVKIKVKMIC